MGKGAYAVGFLIECGFELLNSMTKDDEVGGLQKGYAFLERRK